MTKNFGSSMGQAGFGSFSFVGASMGGAGLSQVTGQPHLYLSLEMGEFCPLHCKHCIYESKLTRQEGHPREDVLSAIEISLSTIVPTWVSFSGKEPTAYPDELERMMNAVRQRRTSPIVVMTNGLKIPMLSVGTPIPGFVPDDAIMLKYGSKKPLGLADLIDISLDGDQAAHDWCRGKGTFVRTMENVRALVSAGKRVGIIATAMNQTLPDGRRQVTAIGALARQLGEEFVGKDNISLTVSLYYGRPGNSMILGERDLVQLLGEVRDTGTTVRILWTSNYAPDSYTFLRPLWDRIEHDRESGFAFIRDGNILHVVFNVAKDPLLGLRVGRGGEVYVGCNHLIYTLEERRRFLVGNIFDSTLGQLAERVLAGESLLGDLTSAAVACGSCERVSICRGGDTLSGMYEGKHGDPFCVLLN